MRGGYKITEINGTQIEIGGDIITSADKQPIQNLEELSHYITNNKIEGDVINIGILRDGKPQEIKITLETKPKDLRQ
jgi:S1-C subfamily serine protease